MGVYIKGMDMPKHCGECRAADWCLKRAAVISVPRIRPTDCPLFEMKDGCFYIERYGVLYKAKVATPEEMGAKTFNVKEYIENGDK